MPADQVVEVTVTAQSSFPTRESFETILLFAYHTIPGPLVREVRSLADASAQGFTTAAYPDIVRALTVLFSQNPRPRAIKIGKKVTAVQQLLNLTPIAAQGEGFEWVIYVDGVEISYTEGPGATVATIIDGIAAAVVAATVGFTPTDNITDLDLAAVAGRVHRVDVDLDYIELVDDTPATNLATELDAIDAADSGWYGLILMGNAPAEVSAASTWCEARIKLLAADAYTSDVIDPGVTTDIGSVLETAQRQRTLLVWSNGRVGAYYGGGLLAARFAAAEPGVATWAFKAIGGVDTYGPIPLVDQTTLEAKQVNHLAFIAGVHRILQGVVSSGRFIDVTRTIDWIAARQREVLLEVLLVRDKVPFIDEELAVFEGVLQNFWQLAVASRVVAPGDPDDPADPPPSVTIPLVSTISAADRAARILPDVETSARLAGAVHSIRVNTLLQF